MFNLVNRFKDGKLIPLKGKRAIPVNHQVPLTFEQRVARILRDSEFSRMVEARGLETFEEADDFDIEDDDKLPHTPYEADFDLAAAHASARGVVATPSSESLAKANEVIGKLKDVEPENPRKSYFKRKQKEALPPPAPTDAPAQ